MRELYDSGVEWIKQIPVSWGLQKLKYLTTKCERGTAPDYTDDVAIMVVNQATFSKGFLIHRTFVIQQSPLQQAEDY